MNRAIITVDGIEHEIASDRSVFSILDLPGAVFIFRGRGLASMEASRAKYYARETGPVGDFGGAWTWCTRCGKLAPCSTGEARCYSCWVQERQDE